MFVTLVDKHELLLLCLPRASPFQTDMELVSVFLLQMPGVSLPTPYPPPPLIPLFPLSYPLPLPHLASLSGTFSQEPSPVSL